MDLRKTRQKPRRPTINRVRVIFNIRQPKFTSNSKTPWRRCVPIFRDNQPQQLFISAVTPSISSCKSVVGAHCIFSMNIQRKIAKLESKSCRQRRIHGAKVPNQFVAAEVETRESSCAAKLDLLRHAARRQMTATGPIPIEPAVTMPHMYHLETSFPFCRLYLKVFHSPNCATPCDRAPRDGFLLPNQSFLHQK